MLENGNLPASALAAIPEGHLAVEAAGAWNAKGGPADNGLRPSGPNASYRLKSPGSRYGTQEWFYAHQPPLAAYPGTSNHGWGHAVDLAEEWMRGWIDDHGARFGWKKTEAFSEWWHVNYIWDGHDWPPAFEPLRHGDRGKRVRFYGRRLAYIHHRDGGPYLLDFRGRKFTGDMERAVRTFQEDNGLDVDGVIGEETAHRISAVFHRQYVKREGKRKRSRKVAVREAAAKLRHGDHPQHHPERPTRAI